MPTAVFVTKEEIWMEETTRYWFDFEGEQVAVCESPKGNSIVDQDGCPVTQEQFYKLESKLTVTDEMRAQ